MSLLDLSGTDGYPTAGIGQYWEVFNGSVAVEIGSGRFGGNSINAPQNSAANANFARNIPATTDLIIGFAFNPSATASNNNTICRLLTGSTLQCELRLNTAGTLSVTRNNNALTNGTSTATIPTNAWSYIEWKVTIADSIAANSCQVRLNGGTTPIINVAAGQDTKNATASTADRVSFGTSAGTLSVNRTWRFADFYIISQDSTAPNDWLGDVRVDTIRPNAPGSSTQWSPLAGANWENLISNDGDDSYVETSTSGHLDLYTAENLPSTPASIHGLKVSTLARKTDAGTREIQTAIRTGGNNFFGDNFALGNSYQYVSTRYALNPDTAAAWTKAQIDALEIGQRDNT